MSAYVQVAPSEEQSCCSCNTDNVGLTRWADAISGLTHQHCDLCMETEFGSRCRMKTSGYGDAMSIMRHMIQLEHIRNKKAAGV